MSIDFRQAGHLPKLRDAGEPGHDPRDLPRQRRGITPQMHGRYPDYDVLAESGHWDSVTQRVVTERVANPPAYAFFDEHEIATLNAFCDVVTAQDTEPRIPVLRYIDQRLANGKLDGWQYADMPDDYEVWHRTASGLDDAARERGAEDFASADDDIRHDICERFASGELEGGVWDGMPIEKAWGLVMRFIVSAFYAHPWAWNEIGFGGPAYPRGYSRLGPGMRETWEGREAFERDPVADRHGDADE